MLQSLEILHFHLFCGLGGGARGFNRGQARVGSLRARFRCDPAAIRDFERLAGVPGTVRDLFDREQYKAFHGHEPPAEWREATPDDIRRAAGGERPHIVFLSPPCKGFSGLLSESKSKSGRYQALNRLTVRGLWLMLEAWADEPPELIVFENVPRIASRGRHLLDQIGALLRSYGYAVAETAHDCGELGGLAQSRKRFLLVARHTTKIPVFLYEPIKRPLRAVGDVLSRLPMPDLGLGGPMHRMPRLQWKTWVRLAFVGAGSDWRSLSRLRVQDGQLADYGIMPVRDWQDGTLGVLDWNGPAGSVIGAAHHTNGRYSVADPRFHGQHEYGQYGVRRWEEPTGAVSAQSAPGGGRYAVADPRIPGVRHNNVYRIIDWNEHAQAITAGAGPSSGRLAVADPRPHGPIHGKYAVVPFERPAGTVIAGSTTGQGAYAVADPRTPWNIAGKNAYRTQANFGVVPWASPCGAVTGFGQADNGKWSVADPRTCEISQTDPNACLPEPADKLVAVIRALDGTWHRPFTTLELVALQGLVDPEEQLALDGLSDSAWRERIGNAVPPPAAQAIAGVMGQTLLLAASGETFSMSQMPVWVRPVVAGLMAGR